MIENSKEPVSSLAVESSSSVYNSTFIGMHDTVGRFECFYPTNSAKFKSKYYMDQYVQLIYERDDRY